ncbi:ESX-1 secretion-associated protein [Mycobacterium sp. M1]|uniref:ESX-1 secretion-associated protein n=1 Tax=Mycolicibacter acidiphilus TaxID=2835306 RepID=A0ABS5REU1_9MYCO|nr:ESX-1 secretion-associated protein [Mycolicibacter acidiphilus]MBS9532805.1 ESX-1 secretion-associated protein [Mycolicibacter acidiphilus]
MGDLLKVDPADVRKAASHQQEAATQLGSAATAANGVGASMGVNHGFICSGTAAATVMAEQARSLATLGVQSVSVDLSEKLQAAATMYETTDQQQAAKINERMHPQ